MGDLTTVATVKSALSSRTNITAALLAIFSLLSAVGVLPASFEAPAAVNTIVLVGAGAVAYFRTFTNAIIKH